MQDTNKKEESPDEEIAQRFAELPAAVQEAITSTNVEEKLRGLSAKYKLHLDQWVLLENEIMLTLLGLEEPEDMVKNIATEVKISNDVAQKLVNDIGQQIFKPIREAMQGSLSRDALARGNAGASGGINTQEKRAPSDTLAYQRGQSSVERKDVQEDPYRESIE